MMTFNYVNALLCVRTEHGANYHAYDGNIYTVGECRYEQYELQLKTVKLAYPNKI